MYEMQEKIVSIQQMTNEVMRRWEISSLAPHSRDSYDSLSLSLS